MMHRLDLSATPPPCIARLVRREAELAAIVAVIVAGSGLRYGNGMPPTADGDQTSGCLTLQGRIRRHTTGALACMPLREPNTGIPDRSCMRDLVE